ncbi:MAG: hypothetical protein ACLTZY_00815 [Alistipes indistinctus]
MKKSHLQNTTAKTYLPDPTELISTDSLPDNSFSDNPSLHDGLPTTALFRNRVSICWNRR